MTRKEIYDLYVLQSRNVRKLNKVKDNLIKDINFYIKRADFPQVDIKTKLLALLYSTFSEAQFLQVIHTPDGLTDTEIDEIKKIKSRNIIEGWKLLIDLAFKRVGKVEKSGDLENRKQKLNKIIEAYIWPQSLMRNKIAHGQWIHALNRENTKENTDLTHQMSQLDIVQITKWFEIHKYLGFIVRDLLQSPKKAFHNNYWANVTELEEYLRRTKNWDFESKKNELVKKVKK